MDQNQALSELAAALKAVTLDHGPPPSQADGWMPMEELIRELGCHEATVRYKLRKLGGRVERKRYGHIMYYRIARE